MKFKEQSPRRFARAWVLKLHPLVVLVLVDEQVEVDLTLPHEARGRPIKDLDYNRLSPSCDVKGYDLIPDRVRSIYSYHLRLHTLLLYGKSDHERLQFRGEQTAPFNDGSGKDAVEHDAELIHLFRGLDFLQLFYYLLSLF